MMLTKQPSTFTQQYQRVRARSEHLIEPLSAEDCVVQSMPAVSPTRWHLAHTTWFFETFLLKALEDYQVFDPSYEYLFNSYYNAVGEQYPQARRGLLSRPGLDEVLRYRRHVDRALLDWLERDEPSDAQRSLVALGLQHEQQHQELILTDIKHVLSCHPFFPTYRAEGGASRRAGNHRRQWLAMEEGLVEIGYDADGFAFDNESPRHRVFLEAFQLASCCVTNGEYLEFIEQGGYQQPQWWLSMGWNQVREQNWTAPLYWARRDGRWMEYTLGGLGELDLDAPVCHVSYFEADAFARWAGARLPTEAEWEVAAETFAAGPNEAPGAAEMSSESEMLHPSPAEATAEDAADGLYDKVWQWTSSSYAAYPGYQPAAGAIGEYNGKFMCNQYVLRGGSCVTPPGHTRPTYRNFFPPETRWQFSGIRLAK